MEDDPQVGSVEDPKGSDDLIDDTHDPALVERESEIVDAVLQEQEQWRTAKPDTPRVVRAGAYGIDARKMDRCLKAVAFLYCYSHGMYPRRTKYQVRDAVNVLISLLEDV